MVMDSERPSAAEMLERADGRRRRQRRSAQDVLTIECDAPVSTSAFVIVLSVDCQNPVD